MMATSPGGRIRLGHMVNVRYFGFLTSDVGQIKQGMQMLFALVDVFDALYLLPEADARAYGSSDTFPT